MTMKDSALQYFDGGIHIAACLNNSRVVAQPSFSDREEVSEFFSNYPDANIALRTGSINQILVLSVNYVRGQNESLNGLVSFDSFEEKYGSLPTTLRADKPSGGFHLYYHYSSCAPISCPGLESGITLHGEDQFVLLPPSALGGNFYVWSTVSLIGNPDAVEEAPSWLVELGTDNWPESWPTPVFEVSYDRSCWLHAMRLQEETAGKTRFNFEASDWEAVQSCFDQMISRIAARYARRHVGNEDLAVSDTVTVE